MTVVNDGFVSFVGAPTLYIFEKRLKDFLLVSAQPLPYTQKSRTL